MSRAKTRVIAGYDPKTTATSKDSDMWGKCPDIYSFEKGSNLRGLNGFSIRRVKQESFLAPNNKKPEDIAKIKDCFLAGLSIRVAACRLGFSKCTVNRYYKKFVDIGKQRPLCMCGKPSAHRSWCSWRFRHSPARIQFMKRWKGIAERTESR